MITAALARWQEKPEITRPGGRDGTMPHWRSAYMRESNRSRELSKFPDNP